MSDWINRTNHVWIRRLIRQWTDKLQFRNPLFWIYTPFSAPVLDGFDVDSVYECVDEFRAAKGLISPAVIGEMEDSLLRKVRMTVVTHENLLAHRGRLCANTFHIPNAADTLTLRDAAMGRFETPADIAKIPHPRFGFVGFIHYWIDLNLIRFLAAKRPDWSFILIGPKSRFTKLGNLNSYRNVYLLGRKSESAIASYLQSFDCCINPYLTGPLAEHCNPLKLYEYLAAGKPVVSTDMQAARQFNGEVDVAASYEEFLKMCSDRIAQLPEPPSTIERRLKVAEPHSWESRFNELNELLDKIFVA
jgi:glycosyltransferase involved in cell wall biosynthesis